MFTPLSEALILLAGSVFLVTLVRRLALPTSMAYLLVGLVLGPHALGVVSDSGTVRLLAELGVAFLLFTLGLEFSLPRMLAMRREVFGLGALQVIATAGAFALPRPPARHPLARRHRARRRGGDELDRDPAAAAHRARRAQSHPRPAGVRDAVVPGPGVRAVSRPRRHAGRGRKSLPARRQRIGGHRRRACDRGGARCRPLAAAPAVSRDRPQPPARAVHARGAAGGAVFGLDLAPRRSVVRTRRVSLRHDARRDRVPPSDRRGDPPVSRPAARAVLHLRRHAARHAPVGARQRARHGASSCC